MSQLFVLERIFENDERLIEMAGKLQSSECLDQDVGKFITHQFSSSAINFNSRNSTQVTIQSYSVSAAQTWKKAETQDDLIED